jgi:ABC-type sugar transport system ATPase subunit
MVGRTIADHYPKREPRAFGHTLLEVEDEAAAECGGRMRLRSGEIVGLAGLVGAGRSEWIQDLFCGRAAGRLQLRGNPVRPRSPHQSRQLGLGYVPGDRKAQGLFLDLSVRENLTITVLERISGALGILRPARLAEIAQSTIRRLRIRCANDRVRVRTLSGGNQQKVAMAKWLARESDILILDEPTRGVDIGAKEEIYRLILNIARSGKGVLLVSSELPELLSLSDRIYVMRKGRFVAELEAAHARQEELIALASDA